MTTVMSAQRRCPRLIGAAVLGAFLIALGSGALVRAGTPEEVAPSITVHYSDLDLATEQGTHALYLRIVEAARKVCDPHDPDALAQIAVAYCQEQTIARAVSSVGNPRLAALHAAREKHGARHS